MKDNLCQSDELGRFYFLALRNDLERIPYNRLVGIPEAEVDLLFFMDILGDSAMARPPIFRELMPR